MGTQYEVWNEDKKEYIDGQTLGWDSKKLINTTGRIANMLYFLINTKWNGDRIHIISIEHRDFEEMENFEKENKDISKQVYEELKEAFPNEDY